MRFQGEASNNVNIGIISDSQLKHVVMDNKLEELWARNRWDENVYIYRGATTTDLRDEVRRLGILNECNIILLSAGSNDLFLLEDDTRDSTEIDENDRIIEYTACDIMEIVQHFNNRGALVIWIAPPVRRNRNMDGYVELEKTLEKKETGKFIVIKTAHLDPEDTLANDGTHFTKEAVQNIIKDIGKRIGENWELRDVKLSTELRREEFLHGICWACGDKGHDTRDCRNKREGKLNCSVCGYTGGHNEKTCMVQFRMCHWCGRKGRHNRRNCVGWWAKQH